PQPGAPAQVKRLLRSGHHAEPELTLAEVRLDPADARRAVVAQRRQDLVPVRVEQRPRPAGEVRSGRGHLVPACHRAPPRSPALSVTLPRTPDSGVPVDGRRTGRQPGHAMVRIPLVRNRALDYGRVVTCG